MRSGCSRHMSRTPPVAMPAAPYGSIPRRHTGYRLTLVRPHVVDADLPETDFAAHQPPEGLHDIGVADDFIELGRRQQGLAVLGLPDAVVGPETTEVPTFPFEHIHKADYFVVAQKLFEQEVAVFLEEIEIFLFHCGFLSLHSSGLSFTTPDPPRISPTAPSCPRPTPSHGNGRSQCLRAQFRVNSSAAAPSFVRSNAALYQ